MMTQIKHTCSTPNVQTMDKINVATSGESLGCFANIFQKLEEYQQGYPKQKSKDTNIVLEYLSDRQKISSAAEKHACPEGVVQYINPMMPDLTELLSTSPEIVDAALLMSSSANTKPEIAMSEDGRSIGLQSQYGQPIKTQNIGKSELDLPEDGRSIGIQSEYKRPFITSTIDGLATSDWPGLLTNRSENESVVFSGSKEVIVKPEVVLPGDVCVRTLQSEQIQGTKPTIADKLPNYSDRPAETNGHLKHVETSSETKTALPIVEGIMKHIMLHTPESKTLSVETVKQYGSLHQPKFDRPVSLKMTENNEPNLVQRQSDEGGTIVKPLFHAITAKSNDTPTLDLSIGSPKEQLIPEAEKESISESLFQRIFIDASGENAMSTPVVATHNQHIVKSDTIMQIVDRVAIMVGEGRFEMEIQVKPESMGKLVLRVIKEGDVFSAHIMAESYQARDLIQSHLNELKTALKDRGYDFLRLDVSLGGGYSQQSHGFFHNQAYWHRNSLGKGNIGSAAETASKVQSALLAGRLKNSVHIDCFA